MSPRARTVADYLLVNGLCAAILVWAFQLWRADPRVLLTEAAGDTLFSALQVRGLENGWGLTIAQVGAPLGLELYDFPHPDYLHFAALKLLLWLTGNPIVALNAYFLLTFPLAASTALFVLRHFGVSSPPAIVGSLLFAFVPYHFLRGQAHLAFAAYYMVPLLLMVVLWISTGRPLLMTERGAGGARRRSVASIIICLLMAAGGIYDAFFAAFFLLVAGPYAALRGGGWRAVATAAILIAAVSATLVVSLSPSLLYVLEHGRNKAVAHRTPREAEFYSLKIADLLLPMHLHRIPAAAELKLRYAQSSPTVNENAVATLGVVGSLGFLALLARQLFGRRRDDSLLDALALLVFAAVLLASMGAFGTLFALLVSAQVRAYNRISIYISFLSLFAASIMLDRVGPATGRARPHDPLFLAVCFAALVLGLFDQVSPSFVPKYERLQAEHADRETFIREIESALPRGAMVFQLPYVPFPEGGQVHRMGDYALLLPYLHARTLRLSFGAMRGRPGDAWQRRVASQPVGEMLESLSRAGFHGIYLDRFGYEDGGAAIERELQAALSAPPIVSGSKRMSFFALGNTARRQKRS